jgi:hypothetical protein
MLFIVPQISFVSNFRYPVFLSSNTKLFTNLQLNFSSLMRCKGMTEILMFSDWQQFFVVGSIIFCSQIIYAVLGFGAGMFAVSLMALFYGKLEFIVPFFTLVCLPTELFISWQDRKKINLKSTWIFLTGIIPALFLGSLLLQKTESPLSFVILGSVILLLSVYYLFGEKKFRCTLQAFYWIPSFSLLSGILGGLYAMGGPPLIIYFKHKNLPKSEFRVALISIFAVMTIFRFLFYLYLKMISVSLLLTALSALPFALFGLLIGNVLHNRISDGIFKIVTSIALAISGFLIILKNV